MAFCVVSSCNKARFSHACSIVACKLVMIVKICDAKITFYEFWNSF